MLPTPGRVQPERGTQNSRPLRVRLSWIDPLHVCLGFSCPCLLPPGTEHTLRTGTPGAAGPSGPVASAAPGSGSPRPSGLPARPAPVHRHRRHTSSHAMCPPGPRSGRTALPCSCHPAQQARANGHFKALSLLRIREFVGFSKTAWDTEACSSDSGCCRVPSCPPLGLVSPRVKQEDGHQSPRRHLASVA